MALIESSKSVFAEEKTVCDTPDVFEGPEKLLEVWFAKPTDLKVQKLATPKSGKDLEGLRKAPQESWVEILKLVKCTILSVTRNEFFDAYVLSESSLFVWPQKVILKTCGTTVLLLALPAIFQLGRDYGLTIIGDVFYSRRNFFFQQRQLAPHSSFDDEVKFLDDHLDGSAYILGKTNRGNHWYLYLTDTGALIDNSSPKLGLLDQEQMGSLPSEPDYTFEVLMTDLDRQVMKQFYKSDKSITARSITESSGIATLFPEAILDDYLFEPCGYSMNGLLGNGYFTIHVTPQPQCSYVSFETNIHCNFGALLERVLSIFKPRDFTVTLFAGGPSPSKEFPQTVEAAFPSYVAKGMFRRSITTHYYFENGYKLAFTHYEGKAKIVGKRKRKLKDETTNGSTKLLEILY